MNIPSTRAVWVADGTSVRCPGSGLSSSIQLSLTVANKEDSGGLNMVRRLTSSIALAAACVLGNVALAQEATTKAVSAKPNMTMASYNSHYASASHGGGNCATCNSSSGSSYGMAGGNAGGPHAMAYGRVWGGAQSDRDCNRFYHYPYVYYPQNFMGDEYFRSSDSLYHRYPAEMQIPVYNRHWHNYYPSSRRYHSGHHFILDVF